MADIDSEASPEPAKAAEFNRMEKLRDPSHVRAMPLVELKNLYHQVGLPAPRVTNYRLEGELEGLLSRSFPLPGDADKIREIFGGSLGDDRLGIPMSRDGERIRYAYRVAILVAVSTPWLAVGLIGFAAMGAAQSMTAVSSNTAIQSQVSDDYRGRVLFLGESLDNLDYCRNELDGENCDLQHLFNVDVLTTLGWLK